MVEPRRTTVKRGATVTKLPTSVTVDDATSAQWTELADAWTGGNRSRALALALAVAVPLVPAAVADLKRVPDAEQASAWAEALLAERGTRKG
jgi:hypothetical protein